MALASPGTKKMAGTVTDVSGGAAPPTADAGSNITTNDTTLVTLNGSGSTAGATMAWSLVDPAGADQTSRLSSTTVISPTFTPLPIPGLWVATLQVTVSGVTSQDNCQIRVGDVNGWIRLNPDAASSTSTSGNYATVTWADDGADWTTMTLAAKTGSTLNPTDCEIKWFSQTQVTNLGHVNVIQWKVVNDESHSQPVLADYCFAGIVVADSASPTGTGIYQILTTVNQAEVTKRSVRGTTQSIAWGGSGTGYDALFSDLSFRPYYGDTRRIIYYRTTVSGATHTSTTDTNTALALTLTDTDPLFLGLLTGRSGTTVGDKTFKFQVWYKVGQR